MNRLVTINLALVLSVFPAKRLWAEEQPISLSVLADRVLAVYQRAEGLVFEFNTTHLERGRATHLRCEIYYGPGYQSELLVYDGVKLIYQFRSRLDKYGQNVLIDEENHVRPRQQHSRVPVTDISPNQSGKDEWDLQCVEGVPACLFGWHWRSWVGPESPRPYELADRIRAGIYLGRQTTEDHLCDVVTLTDDYATRILYFDAKTHLLIRYVTVYCPTGAVRDRLYTYYQKGEAP